MNFLIGTDTNHPIMEMIYNHFCTNQSQNYNYPYWIYKTSHYHLNLYIQFQTHLEIAGRISIVPVHQH